jgi:hypothetical protein
MVAVGRLIFWVPCGSGALVVAVGYTVFLGLSPLPVTTGLHMHTYPLLVASSFYGFTPPRPSPATTVAFWCFVRCIIVFLFCYFVHTDLFCWLLGFSLPVS